MQDQIDAIDGVVAALQVSQKWLRDGFVGVEDPIVRNSVKALQHSLEISLKTAKNIERHYDGFITKVN